MLAPFVRPSRFTARFRPRARGGGPASRARAAGPSAPRPRRPCGPQTADEVALAIALTARWMLITGRRIDQLPLLHDLPGDQLIDFWADDHVNGPPPTAARTSPATDRTPSDRRPDTSNLRQNAPGRRPRMARVTRVTRMSRRRPDASDRRRDTSGGDRTDPAADRTHRASGRTSSGRRPRMARVTRMSRMSRMSRRRPDASDRRRDTPGQ